MRVPRSGAIALAACLALSGCGLKPASAFLPSIKPGSIQPIANLKGATIRVTSKEFTEQIILGKIAVLALKAAGAKVVDKTNVQGSINARRSIQRGDADLMWEYTGTGWITYLGHDKPIPDPKQQFDAVKAADLRLNKIDWVDPAPLNNTYVMAMTRQTEQKYGLHSLSDMAKLPRGKRTYCVDNEFFVRTDGFVGMLKAYGLRYPSDVGTVSQMAGGVIYTSVAHGSCTFGEVTETDGRIQALKLVTLTDDRHFFPNYNAAITVRDSVLKAHPEIARIFARISPKLTITTMRHLNAEVDVDGGDPAIVARDWLRSQGFVR